MKQNGHEHQRWGAVKHECWIRAVIDSLMSVNEFVMTRTVINFRTCAASHDSKWPSAFQMAQEEQMAKMTWCIPNDL